MKNWVKKYFHKSKDRKDYKWYAVKGFLSILDGIVSVVSLGSVWSSFEYEYTKNTIFNTKEK